MIANIKTLVNKNLGSSLSLPAHGLGGARAISLLAAHFALRNTASNSAEKKSSPSEGVAEGGGWGGGIFARPSVRFLPREARQSIRISFKKGSSSVQ